MNQSSNKIIYLDNAATTPCDHRVIEAMYPYWTQFFGNPSSPHVLGRIAANVLDDRRAEISSLLKGSGSVVFTSGATESNNLAINSLIKHVQENLRRHKILCLSTEHKSIINTINYYCTNMDIEVEWIPANEQGLVDIEELEQKIDSSIGAVITQLANSETGVIQDLQRISKLCHRFGAVCFSDITQAIGKIPVQLDDFGVDFASFTAHKFYGPKGIGAVYVAPGMGLAPLLHGGAQEKNVRPGTENVTGVVGMAEAIKLCVNELERDRESISILRNQLWHEFEQIHGIKWNGFGAPLLPSHLNITISGVNAQDLLLRVRRVAFSAGSACNTSSNLPSQVLLSMGLTGEQAEQTIRLSLGRFNSQEDIDTAITYFRTAIDEIRLEA